MKFEFEKKNEFNIHNYNVLWHLLCSGNTLGKRDIGCNQAQLSVKVTIYGVQKIKVLTTYGAPTMEGRCGRTM